MDAIRKLLGLFVLAVVLTVVSAPAFAQDVTLTPSVEHEHNSK